MRVKIFLLTLFLFSTVVHASGEEFSLSIDDRVYSKDEEINLVFTINSCSQEFRIRPFANIGIAEILDPKTLKWIPQNSVWEVFPYISEKMKIRIKNVEDTKIELRLELQNVKLGQVTKSKGIHLWISDAYRNYVDLLNNNLVIETYPPTDGKIHR